MSLPHPGDRIGPYVCERLLAHGGMGAVYTARHVELGRAVALKVILAPKDADAQARFLREVEACGRLNHPNLVRVHDSGEADGRLYLAMELIEGESLQTRLERGGPLDPRAAADLIRQAAAGIAHAHAAGVLHRDLKPGNLLWDTSLQTTRVVDFGLTGRLSSAGSLTATGEILGTPGFLAPEQAEGGEVGPGADVYGLGATLFALVAGRPPFVGTGLGALAAQVKDAAPDLRELRPEVDRDLAQIVARALNKPPAERQPSAEALAEDLRRYLSGERSAGGGGGARRARVTLGLALCLALLGGVARSVYLRAEAGAAAQTLVEFAEWRAARLEPFAFGWGAAAPGLAEELEGWKQRLAAARSGAEPAAWGSARDEVQAHELVLAQPGGERAPPDGEASSGDSAWLARATLALRREDSAGAKDALGRVSRAGRERLGFRLSSGALRASTDPRAYMRALEQAQGSEREGLLALGGRTIRCAAPEASPILLATWAQRLTELGAPGLGEALRAALEETAPRWGQELARVSVPEQTRLLKTLCGPLRALGLWPGQRFARAARDVFEPLARAELARDQISPELLALEHELFYRVEPRPCGVPGWRNALRSNWITHVGRATEIEPLLFRSSARAGLTIGGLTALERVDFLQSSLHPTSEPGGRLEALAAWLTTYAAAPPGVALEALAAFQRALESPVDDLHPRILGYALSNLSDLAAGNSPEARALAEFLDPQARAVTRAVLEEYRGESPGDDFLETYVTTSFAAARLWLGLHELERGFAWTDVLERLQAAAKGAPEAKRLELLAALSRGYGLLGTGCSAAGSARLGLGKLDGARELVRQYGQLQTRGEYYAWLLTAWREAGITTEAKVLVDSLRAEPERKELYLSLQVAPVLEEMGEPGEALRVLRDAREEHTRRLGPRAAKDATLGYVDQQIAALRARHPQLVD